MLCVSCGAAFGGASTASALSGYTSAGSFGSPGSGDGQLVEPTGVAVSDTVGSMSAGDVYVVDTGNNRVERFDSAGKYLSQFGGGETPAKSFVAPQGIAVDNAGPSDPSTGDVYVTDVGHGVVDKFDEEGAYQAQLTGVCPAPGPCAPGEVIPFGELLGVAVDSSGNVWVHDGEGNFDEFSSSGEFIASFVNGRPPQHGGLAIDTNGDLYAVGGEAHLILKLDSTTEEELAEISGGVTALAVAPETNNLLVAAGETIELYGPFGQPTEAPLQTFPAGEPGGSEGVAVGASGTAYVSEHGAGNVHIFTFGPLKPSIEQVTVTGIGTTSATVHARIGARGEAGSYRVEYGMTDQYGSATPPASLGSGSAPVGVTVQLSGLQAGTTYHFRVVATNGAGPATSGDETFSTRPVGTGPSGLPDARAYELVSGVGTPGEVYVPAGPEQNVENAVTEFPFRASVDGDSVAYVGDPSESGGNGLTGSALGNEYLATRQANGWAPSTITPQAAGHEEAEHGTEFQGLSDQLATGVLGAVGEHFAASTSPQGPGSCNALYARSPGVGFKPLFTQTSTPGFCGLLPLISEASPTQSLLFAGGNKGTAAVEAFSQLLFQSRAALTAGAVEAEEGEGEGDNLYVSAANQPHLVSRLPDGTPDVHGVFGAPAIENTHRFNLDNVISSDGSRIFWTDVSTQRIYARQNALQPQSPLGSGGECLVPTDACTVPVSGGEAKYWSATADGHFAFYTEHGELWRYDAQNATREAIVHEGSKGEAASVKGVVATSEDGSSIYVVAEAQLTPGASPRKCREAREEESEASEEERAVLQREQGEEEAGRLPLGRGCNLYLVRPGETTDLVAVLAAKDNKLKRESGGGVIPLGAWQPDSGSRTAEAAPDGHGLVFESTQQLTGYDNSNLDVFSPENGHRGVRIQRQGRRARACLLRIVRPEQRPGDPAARRRIR